MTEQQVGYADQGMDPHTSMIMLAVLARGLGIRRTGSVFVIYDEGDHRTGLFSLEQWDEVEAMIAQALEGRVEGSKRSVLRLASIFITQHCRWSGNHNGLVEIDPGRLERFVLVHSSFLAKRWGRPEINRFVNEGVYPVVKPAEEGVKP